MSEKIWDVYLIHHSHTDIGYTERQDKITRYHYDFIRQAIKLLDLMHQQQKPEYQGFVWQCENFWQVKQFYRFADDELKNKFEAYVKSGEIGLSGNYLNMTDLTLEAAFSDVMEQVKDYGKRIGHTITAGMSADINGLAWGYPEILFKHGLRYFYTALHPHHGMFPLNKKTCPYYWETESGNRILMWNGDHYHLGNEMFLVPHAGSDYTFHDEYTDGLRNNSILNKDADSIEQKELEICTKRIGRYLDNLEQEGYPYDLVPFMVSGAITDNAPPNIEIARRAHKLTELFEGRVRFKMVTLEQFFEQVEKRCCNIPTYRGDFTDWWADGVGSTPAATKIYLDAARKYDLCKKLDPDNKVISSEDMLSAAENLMLYAEHTWGYSSSVSEPWDSMVESLEYKKTAYATNANTAISKGLDDIMADLGEVAIRQDKPQHYIIKNPHNHRLRTSCYLYIEFWEYIDGVCYDSSMPIVVTNSKTGEVLKSQIKGIARATQVEVTVDLAPGEMITAELHLENDVCGKENTVKNHAHIGADGIEDLLQDVRKDEYQIDTKCFRIRFNENKGIESIVWNADGTELLRHDSDLAPFSGVYEITDIDTNPCDVRRRMGRNRKSCATHRYFSKLRNRRIVEDGPVYSAIELDYELMGTGIYTIFLKAYAELPKLEFNVRIHKSSNWEPENLYIALPFTTGDDSSLYVNKTGCIIRPGIDQLPGTCQDFYLIQNTVAWNNGHKTVALITKDAPLITLGDLQPRRIVLCNQADEERNRDQVFSWPMNNFWETNFKVSLGGFYEFRYTLMVDEDSAVTDVFKKCESENEGILTGYAE
ncbi:hypothetical protein [Butyrivibrio sp. WCD3002]|uniref:glycoside hydrolase family 38 N-terminal domain-containing protein n=1 Tax=Butyrivibrio sp. WCD3002 TaxID=1280676 RepID=UPI0003F85BA3|nr:hypothetical protein [Butyrivibrio sp. WCD3002]